MIDKKIIIYLVSIITICALLYVFWHFIDKGGYDRCSIENEVQVSQQKTKIIALQAKIQRQENDKAEHTRSLSILNAQRVNAVQSAEDNRDEINELDKLWRQALNERDAALAKNIRLVDVEHIKRVYSKAVKSCVGLPDSISTGLVPVEHQQSASEFLAEGIKRLASKNCFSALNYNALYDSYQSVLNEKVK